MYKCNLNNGADKRIDFWCNYIKNFPVPKDPTESFKIPDFNISPIGAKLLSSFKDTHTIETSIC
jgi:hypothetical protein